MHDGIFFIDIPPSPVEQHDCNLCGWLDHTEWEFHIGHKCMFYNKPIYHRSNTQQHNPNIWPCRDCCYDKYKHYMERRINKT